MELGSVPSTVWTSQGQDGAIGWKVAKRKHGEYRHCGQTRLDRILAEGRPG